MVPRELDAEELSSFARELDELRAAVRSRVGDEDVRYIRRVITAVRGLEIGGRALLHLGIGPVSFVFGTGALALSKVLENMEVGHNVMHGQYDFAGDPRLDGRRYEWDMAATGEDWRQSHNREHHIFTNIVGKDRDLGFAIIRVSADQPWHKGLIYQPLFALWLALAFEWGIGLFNLRIEETLEGTRSREDLARRARPFLRKAAWQVARDYLLYPLLAGPNAPRVLAGNLAANVIRNLWAFSIIFCGHLPEGIGTFTEEATRHESRGQWYRRQVLGTANLQGSRLFHILSGHLGFQIEHHLFPRLPARRYPEIAPAVRALCEKYGQPYQIGRLGPQVQSFVRRIFRYARPVAD